MRFLNLGLFFFFFLVCGGPRLGSSFDDSMGASRRLEPLQIIVKDNLVMLHEPEGEKEVCDCASERASRSVSLSFSGQLPYLLTEIRPLPAPTLASLPFDCNALDQSSSLPLI